MEVSERKITIDEILSAHESGQLKEIFGSGTAAVISPVGEIRYDDRDLVVSDGQVGPIAQRLYNELTDIQYGRAKDPMGWVVPVS
jgi:branched-chain amino acid aminotransferase